MWSFRVLAPVLCLCAVVLEACGFRPLYGGYREGDSPAELAAIRIEPIADRIGQQLHNRLLDVLTPRGRPVDPDFVLRVRLEESIERLAVDETQLATRANFRLAAKYGLVRMRDRKLVLNGRAIVVSGYNILTADFATLMAEKDAKRRAVLEIGDRIRTRLAVHFVQHRTGPDRGAP